MLAGTTTGIGLVGPLHQCSPVGTVGVIRKGSAQVPSIRVGRGASAPTRPPLGRRDRLGCRSDRTLRKWEQSETRTSGYGCHWACANRQPCVQRKVLSVVRRHPRSFFTVVHSFHRPTPRSAAFIWWQRPSCHAETSQSCFVTKGGLNRYNVGLYLTLRTVIHRLLRCPAH